MDESAETGFRIVGCCVCILVALSGVLGWVLTQYALSQHIISGH